MTTREAEPDPPAARFAARVFFSKTEVFAACQALADADRALSRSGRDREAEALGDLFELFEERLSRWPQLDGDSASGSYSRASEFTQ
jgi:hypothetical protein